MHPRTFKIIMAVITFAIILAIITVCICIPLQLSTTQGTLPGTARNKGVERDVNADSITLQHIDDGRGINVAPTKRMNYTVQESDDFPYTEINAQESEHRVGNLAMLKALEPTHSQTGVNAAPSTARSYPRADIITQVNDLNEESLPVIDSSESKSANVVDIDSPASNKIAMPDNLAEDVKSNLASIANSLDSMVQLLHGMQQKTDKMFDNMTATMNGLFQSLPNLLSATPKPSPRDCTDIAEQGHNESSSYVIYPDGTKSYTVYCDLDSDGGGWTVFQRRFDGSVDFYQSWKDYVDGFGKAYGEHWAGLELIHQLTKTGTWELLIQLEDFDGNLAFAHYASFRVGAATSNYRLYIGAYDGTAGDAMTVDNHNKEFSTHDQDNDERSWGNCAQYRRGAWWYGSCSQANLNGLYLGPKKVTDTGLYWWKWKHRHEVLKRSEMKVRRVQ